MKEISESNTETCLFDQIATALVDSGYVVLDSISKGFFSYDLLADFTEECRSLLSLDNNHSLQRAGVGRTNELQVNNAIRGDFICWLGENTPAATRYLEWMEKLRLALNQRLFMGLFAVESHYALYPPGTFYKKHRDAFRGQPNRKLSSVLYLNPEWSDTDGGELLLYKESDNSLLLKLPPEYGKMILFLSEDFPHEVLPACRARQSIAGWFRINKF